MPLFCFSFLNPLTSFTCSGQKIPYLSTGYFRNKTPNPLLGPSRLGIGLAGLNSINLGISEIGDDFQLNTNARNGVQVATRAVLV